MSIRFTCRSCRARLKAREEHAGEWIVCTECGEEVQAPGGDFEPVAEGRPSRRRRDAGASTPVVPLLIGGGIVLLLALMVGAILLGRRAGAQGGVPVAAAPVGGGEAKPGPKAQNAAPEKLNGGQNGRGFNGPNPGAKRNGGQNGAANGGGFQQPADEKAAIVWRLVVDPPAEGPAFPLEKRSAISLPRFGGRDLVVIPEAPSPYFAIYASSGLTHTCTAYDARSGKETGSVEVKTSGSPLHLSPDGRHVATRTIAGGVAAWDVQNGVPLGELDFGNLGGKPGGASQVIVSRIEFGGGKLITLAGSGSRLLVWSLPEGKLERDIDLERKSSPTGSAFCLSPGGRYAVWVGSGDRLQAWDLTTGESAGSRPLPPRGGSTRQIVQVQFSPDGTELAVLDKFVGAAGQLFVFDAATGEIAATHDLPRDVSDSLTGDFECSRPFEWFPNGQRWLLYGRHVVDRDKGGPVWSAPQTRTSGYGAYRILDDESILAADSSSKQIATLEMPIAEIDAAREKFIAGGTADDIGLPNATPANVAGVQRVAGGASGRWAARLDGIAFDARKPQTTIDLDLSGQLDVAFSAPDAGIAFVAERSSRELSRSTLQGGAKPAARNPDAEPRIDRFDLRTGKKLGRITSSIPGGLVAASPAGDRIAWAHVAGGRVAQRIDVLNATDGSHVVAFYPYRDGDSEHQRGMKGALFLDRDHLMTVSSVGLVRVWKIPECRALYEMTHHGSIAFTPGRKYSIVHGGMGPLVCESLTGAAVGGLRVEGMMSAAACHPDGTRVAVASHRPSGESRLALFDLATGKETSSFLFPGSARTIEWMSDTHLLLDCARLVDIDKQAVLWRYELPNARFSDDSPFGGSSFARQLNTPRAGHFLGSGDLCHWYLGATGRDALQLAGVLLPEGEVRRLAAGKKVSEDLLLGPGDEVSLFLALGAVSESPEMAKSVRERLVQQLEKNGITVVEKSNRMLSLTTLKRDTGASQTYSRFGGNPLNSGRGAPTTTSISEVVCRFSLKLDGKEVWKSESTYSNKGDSIEFLHRGENIQSKLDSRQAQGASGFVLGHEVPSRIYSSTAGRGLGLSLLGPKGTRAQIDPPKGEGPAAAPPKPIARPNF